MSMTGHELYVESLEHQLREATDRVVKLEQQKLLDDCRYMALSTELAAVFPYMRHYIRLCALPDEALAGEEAETLRHSCEHSWYQMQSHSRRRVGDLGAQMVQEFLIRDVGRALVEFFAGLSLLKAEDCIRECHRFIKDVHEAMDNPYLAIDLVPTFVAAGQKTLKDTLKRNVELSKEVDRLRALVDGK
jgi:hypothetical protein